jgi:hypothetical protein
MKLLLIVLLVPFFSLITMFAVGFAFGGIAAIVWSGAALAWRLLSFS